MVWYGEYLRLGLVKDLSTFLQPSGQVLNCCSEALGDNFWLWTARTQRDVISKLNSGDVMRGKVAGNILHIQNKSKGPRTDP